MEKLNKALEEIRRLKRIISELNNQIKAQAERNTRQQKANNSLHTLYNRLKWEIEKKPKKPPMYRGDKDRCDEVIKALEDAGGVNTFRNEGHKSEYYYIGESNIIRFADRKVTQWLLEQVFELKELPPKKIELIEGEFYKCKDSPNDTSIFIYKNVNKYDTSYLCGIARDRSFNKTSFSCFDTIDNIIPATQEQKEILLKRIDDEGYVYNKEKVTLLKKKNVVKFTLSAAKYDRMIVRVNTDSRWRVETFREYLNTKFVIDSNGLSWRYILPFNEETKKFINTTNMPDKEYIFTPSNF